MKKIEKRWNDIEQSNNTFTGINIESHPQLVKKYLNCLLSVI